MLILKNLALFLKFQQKQKYLHDCLIGQIMKRLNTISSKLIISVGSMIIIAITINMAISIYAGGSIIKKMTDEQLTSTSNGLAQLLQS